MAHIKTFINPQIDLGMLRDKLLYYPFSGCDTKVPIRMFLDYVSEFWFVDCYYFSQNSSMLADFDNLEGFPKLKYISESFTGPKIADIESPTDSRRYRYLEPGYLEKLFLYKGRQIRIKFRRGFDYTSLFGPSELEIADDRLGIFFFRGTSSEGGSNHPWISDKKIRMLHGEKKVRLLPKLLDKLPNGGLIVTDVSLGYFSDRPMKETNPYYPLHEFFGRNDISCEEAYTRAKPLEDDQGRRFRCIGYANMSYGPTLIWQVTKGLVL